MKQIEGYVFLRNVRFHAFHGVMPQEGRVGGDFVIDLRVGYPLEKALEHEMHQPSKLLEHVAGRIAKAIEKDFPKVSSIDLTLTKKNPPMGADCDGAGVEVHFKK